MAEAHGGLPSPHAGWRDRPWTPILLFVLAWPVGFAFFVVAVALSAGGSGGQTGRGSRSIPAEAVALLVMVLAGALPAYGAWLASRSLHQGNSVLGWLGLVLNATALAFLAVVVAVNAFELIEVIRVQSG
jgi:hypothetical protein